MLKTNNKTEMIGHFILEINDVILKCQNTIKAFRYLYYYPVLDYLNLI